MTMRSRVGRRTMVVSFASAVPIALATALPALAVAGTWTDCSAATGKRPPTSRPATTTSGTSPCNWTARSWGGRSDSGRFVALARYNTDGTPDGTFGVGGMVTTDMTTGADQAQAVAVQVDQKIVVAGRSGGSGGRFGLARYDTAGVLDPRSAGTARSSRTS